MKPMTYLRAWLIRRLLELKADTDVAIVSVIGREMVVTYGTLVPKRTLAAGWVTIGEQGPEFVVPAKPGRIH